MKLIYTITVDCDIPPSDLYFEFVENDLLTELEDKVAGEVITHNGSFAIDVNKKVEL